MSGLPGSRVITVEREEHVATVWLDRPDKLNAMAPEFWEDFPAIVDALGDDESVRAIVVAGRGRAFTVGLDLEAFAPLLLSDAGTSVAGRREFLAMATRMQKAFSSLADNPKPVIAAVHGWCIGAGLDLVTACDIRLAAEDAVFSVRETRIAMVADVGTLQRMPRIVDPGWLAEVVYTGRDFGAAEAHQARLVTRVLPDAALTRMAAQEMAAAIAANSPLAVQGAKAVLRRGTASATADALDHVALWNAAFLHSDDLAEAVRAHLERRPPDFTGR